MQPELLEGQESATKPADETNLVIYVFSFNRAEFLENCLGSIRECAGRFKTIVYDDNSSDQATKDVLGRWKGSVEIRQPRQSESDHKVGGLNNNMQAALDDARKKNVEYALFIQDDMQLVRSLTDQDLETIEEFFNANPYAILYQSCFMKRCDREHENEKTLLDAAESAYFRQAGHRRQRGFSDVGVFRPQRLNDLFGRLVGGESANNAMAEALELHMGVAVNPFMMWLPMPISHRGKKRSLMLRFQEGLSGGGFHPYQVMTESQARKFTDRDPTIRPFAENWLTCPNRARYQQWAFVGGRSALKELGGWRAKVAELLYFSKLITSGLRRIPVWISNIGKSMLRVGDGLGDQFSRSGSESRNRPNSALMIKKVDKPFGEAQYGYDLLGAYCTWADKPLVLSHQVKFDIPPQIAGFPASAPLVLVPPRKVLPRTTFAQWFGYLGGLFSSLRFSATYLYRWLLLAKSVQPHTLKLLIRNHFPDPEEKYPDPTFKSARTLLLVHSMPDFYDGRANEYDIAWAHSALEKSDGLVFVSRAAQREWSEELNLSSKPQYILGNTCRERDIELASRQSKNQARSRLGISDFGPLFVSVATLQDRKGQIELLECLAGAEFFEKTDARLLFIGYEQQPYAQKLNEAIESRNLGQRVSVLGPKTNALEYILAADYLIQSSKSESFGRVLLEALALGVPVVSTRVGAAEELIAHGHNGFLIDCLPNSDAADLMEALCRSEPDAYEQMSYAAVETYRTRFSNAQFIDGFHRIVDDFVSGNGSARWSADH